MKKFINFVSHQSLVKDIFCLAFAFFIAAFGIASATERGFPPANQIVTDCGVSPKILDTTLRQYFENHKNIFEATILKVGPKPYGQPLANLCWASARINKKYKSTSPEDSVNILFETEAKSGEETFDAARCPIRVGESYLIFADAPIKEQVESFYMSPCSNYTPIAHADYWRALLQIWITSGG